MYKDPKAVHFYGLSDIAQFLNISMAEKRDCGTSVGGVFLANDSQPSLR